VQLAELAANGVRASFLGDAAKEALLEEIRHITFDLDFDLD